MTENPVTGPEEPEIRSLVHYEGVVYNDEEGLCLHPPRTRMVSPCVIDGWHKVSDCGLHEGVDGPVVDIVEPGQLGSAEYFAGRFYQMLCGSVSCDGKFSAKALCKCLNDGVDDD